LFKGGISFDSRGSVAYNNKLQLKKIKRFYLVENKKKNYVRAWHGHKKEAKLIFCVQGKAKVAAVKISNYNKPSKKNRTFIWVIDSKIPNVVYVPPGYANGSMSLTKNMRILVFSTSTLKQSIKDDFRFPSNYWNVWSK